MFREEDEEVDVETNRLVRWLNLTRDKMKKENVFRAEDFSKPWASSDLAFVVEGEQLHVHRWVLSQGSPVFEKMFTSNFSEKDKEQIIMPAKKMTEFHDLLLMVYSLAERSITSQNCSYLLKLADEYQIGFLLEKCEDFLVATSSDIFAGTLSLKAIFSDFLLEQSAFKKEQVLALLILAQEYHMENLISNCLWEARKFSLTELKKDYQELCDLLEPKIYCGMLERIIERMEDRFVVF
ncbi:BTB and MATH domain-containing protein 36-like [Stylophora pistillata]|uniref:BTB and MATH domain-containing protein 36-like n=1 Tax=Stylophora pistillata TaxID=50429 RepID=UPI000C0529C4|nr:BTB and MATH domain-containing protein 36-like [Stylophora pistillata]